VVADSAGYRARVLQELGDGFGGEAFWVEAVGKNTAK
jgi:hypothetical protein